VHVRKYPGSKQEFIDSENDRVGTKLPFLQKRKLTINTRTKRNEPDFIDELSINTVNPDDMFGAQATKKLKYEVKNGRRSPPHPLPKRALSFDGDEDTADGKPLMKRRIKRAEIQTSPREETIILYDIKSTADKI